MTRSAWRRSSYPLEQLARNFQVFAEHAKSHVNEAEQLSVEELPFATTRQRRLQAAINTRALALRCGYDPATHLELATSPRLARGRVLCIDKRGVDPSRAVANHRLESFPWRTRACIHTAHSALPAAAPCEVRFVGATAHRANGCGQAPRNVRGDGGTWSAESTPGSDCPSVRPSQNDPVSALFAPPSTASRRQLARCPPGHLG